jgi:predicted DNA-binding transcriptional regulator YafY
MDKTERLFAIMDALRRRSRPVTAAALAEEQGVSQRTLYRDVHTLIALGAPITGEPGIGYMLKKGFFLPPLMFTAEELEALVLGSRWVEAQGDSSLAVAARNALGKISAASPSELRQQIGDTGLWPISMRASEASIPVLGVVRRAMRDEMALRIDYADEHNQISQREIWPVQLAFHEGKQVVAAWCCLRQAFRHFRTDRIRGASAIDTAFGRRRRILAQEWRDECQRIYPDFMKSFSC